MKGFKELAKSKVRPHRAPRTLGGIPLRTGSLIAAMAAFLGAGLAADPREHNGPSAGPDLDVTTNTANVTSSENLTTVIEFITEGKYLGWEHDPYIRPTGDIYRTAAGSLIDGTTHHRVRIYYSPAVVAWLKQGRKGELPDRSMIVKEMYSTLPPFYPAQDPVIGWAAMVKKTGAVHGGWFWVIYFKPEFRTMATVGEFSYSFCLTCHASTKGEQTFSDIDNLTGANAKSNEGRRTIVVADSLFPLGGMSSDSMSTPPKGIDPAFETLYSNPAIYPYTDVPTYLPDSVGQPFPSTSWDHVWNRVAPPDRSYLTSDNCVGCHDATLLVETEVPNMLIADGDEAGGSSERLLNLSVYGEWRSSPMGMAGRDPIFFAQLESETHIYPQLATEIQNLCLSCHGAMGQRQYVADTKQHNFDMSIVFQTGDGGQPGGGALAKYGALAREGISCMICHQMDPEKIVGVNTGHFERGPWNVIYGPTSPHQDPGGAIRPYPMQQALGLTPEYNPYLKTSEMCGTCHTIVLPVDKPEPLWRHRGSNPVTDDGTPLLSEAHEQDTYLEWFYSAYQNSNPDIPVNKSTAQSCQDCHMRGTLQGNGEPMSFKVANVQDTSWPIPEANNLAAAEKITVPTRRDFARHTFFGMNLFVLNMYSQFGEEVFGLEVDPNPPMGAVNSYDFTIENGEWQIRNETAEVEILDVRRDEGDLVTRVRVINQAGHRLPSGVGFRRAWVELTVVDASGEVLWGSGVTDSQGVIVGPDGEPLASEFTGDWQKIQPHWAEISRQDQVQIYEERYINRYGDKMQLTTSFLGIGEVVKGNRLQPLGYYSDYLRRRLAEARTQEEREKWQSLLPESKLPPAPGSLDPDDDPDYRNGSGADTLTYRIPLRSLAGAEVVRAKLCYQNIPPYYLRDRFSMGRGDQAQRLYYLVGHTETAGTAIADWKITIAEGEAPVPQL